MKNKMITNTYLSTIESTNKVNKRAKQKQTHRYRGHLDSGQMEAGLEGWEKKVKR